MSEENKSKPSVLDLSEDELGKYLSGLTVTELTEIFPYAPWKGKSQRRLVAWCIEDIKETQRFIRIQGGTVRSTIND